MAGLAEALIKLGPALTKAADVASKTKVAAQAGSRLLGAGRGGRGYSGEELAPLPAGGIGQHGGAVTRMGQFQGQHGEAVKEAARGRLVRSLRRATLALDNWTVSLLGSMQRLERYSPEMAAAFARLRVSRIQRDIEFARDVGPGVSRVARARDDFEEALMPLQTVLQNLESAVVSQLLGIATQAVGILNDTFVPMADAIMNAIPGLDRRGGEVGDLLDRALDEAKTAYSVRLHEMARRRRSL